ncbi:MAG: sugar phosphate nucleotidyltransferase [Bacteroidota bacterium]|nr:sugar phosphate nucleotidyltransferase [Bacteroidota bacterium]
MAAGKGSRMKASADVPEWVLEEAASRPKAMIRIGRDRKPLLQHLVERAKEEGLWDICIVVGEHDEITRPHFDALRLDGIDLSFVVQTIPAGRTKPAGTAQAVQLALEAHPDWDGASVTVANGDNLPPFGMFQAMLAYRACLPAFDRDHLGLPAGRVQAFAVISRNDQGGLARIDEKPDEATIQSAIWLDGTVRVSMNYFRVPYCDLLEAVTAEWFAPKLAVMDEVMASDLPPPRKMYEFFARRFILLRQNFRDDPATGSVAEFVRRLPGIPFGHGAQLDGPYRHVQCQSSTAA